jgi:Protein of unknown function (DUF2510)
MQEFESISASSYDPSALATKLTAKAAEGWSVVAIVPTGGDVTAFVTREKGGDSDTAKADDATPAAETKPETKADTAITTAVETIDAVGESKQDDDEPSSPSLVLPAKSEPASDPKPETATEPAGWAVAPEPAATPTTPEPTGVQPAVTIQPATTYEPATSPGYQPAPAPTPASATPASTTPAAATPAAATPAAATPEPVAPAAAAPAVPAGWYADPAGRFELRYWDGSTWTEHVSRAGQQFTDPPVA